MPSTKFNTALDLYGVTAHWTFDDATVSAGSTAADRLGTYNGTYGGTPLSATSPAGIGGKGFSTNGGTGYVTVPDAVPLRPVSGKFGAGFFTSATAIPPTGWATIFRKENNGPYIQLLPTGGLTVAWFDGTLKTIFTDTGLIVRGNPTFVGFEVDPVKGTSIYVNGVLAANDPAMVINPAIFSTGALLWGTNHVPIDTPYSGLIDEGFVRVNQNPLGDAGWSALHDAIRYPDASPVPFKTQHVRIAISSAPEFTPSVVEEAQEYDHLILQHWQTDLRDELRAANPSCRFYAYQNFGHIDPSSTDSHTSTGVAGSTALSTYYAVDGAGHPVPNPSFPWLNYADVSNAGYITAFASQVSARLVSEEWDGVFLDDVNPQPGSVSEGTLVAFPTNDDYRIAVGAALATICPQLSGVGLLVAANIGRWHENPSIVNYWTQYFDYAMVEQGLRFSGASPPGFSYYGYAENTIKIMQVAEKYNCGAWIVMPFADGEDEAARYGMGVLLTGSSGRSGIATPHGVPSNYNIDSWNEEVFDVGGVGIPAGSSRRLSSGVWKRPYSNGVVYVNPQDSSQTVFVESGLSKSGSQLMASKTALILETTPSLTGSEKLAPSVLNEEFDSESGRWDYYDAYDPSLRTILRGQRHVDIRDFRSADVSAPLNVLELSQYDVDTLATFTVSEIEALKRAIKAGENWGFTGLTDYISDGPLATHNNWHTLSISLNGTTRDTSSVISPVNLLDDFEDDDFISLSMPNFPLSSITQPSSYIDLTSEPSGNFATGPTASVPLSATLVPLVAGNSEFRVLRSAFDQNNINLSAITGVRFRIASTGSATLYLAAFRLLSKNWKFGTLDMDTRMDTLVRPVSRNADPTAAPEFAQPIVWRSAEVPGPDDPKPIDFDLVVGFNTGSRLLPNQIIIYGRELTEDFMQQLDLNGAAMGLLNESEQPDIGAAAYNERLQNDLGPFKQEQLDSLSQTSLERTADYLSASWIEFLLSWTSTSTQLSVVNTEGDGYTFNLASPLSANSNYALVFELSDTSARAAIYPLGSRGEIIFNAPVFDSTRIDDDFVYKRRKGRFGWFANLQDGDASVESIRFRSSSYAEYRSLPYESLTPVVGAELTAESTPVIELFETFAPTLDSVVVDRDNERSTTGESWKVTDYGPYTHQGIQSNLFQITDFDQTEINLDMYYPSSSELDANVEFYLKSQYEYLIQLPTPKLYPDQWQSIKLRVPTAQIAQTGNYRLVIVQNRPVNLNWWVDNVRVFERTVSWYGRAAVTDPWAATEDDWTPFQNALNRDFGGILFQGRENRLQIKGVGHKQHATIDRVSFKPAYAELGRFVWPEDELVGRLAPTASYSTSNIGGLYTFNGFGSSDPDGSIVNWYWTISDGTVLVGPIVQHTFGATGSYTVTLMVTDNNGLIDTTSAIHSVVVPGLMTSTTLLTSTSLLTDA